MVQDELVKVVDEALRETEASLIEVEAFLGVTSKSVDFSALGLKVRDYRTVLIDSVRLLADELPMNACIRGFTEASRNPAALKSLVNKVLHGDSEESSYDPRHVKVLQYMDYSATYYETILTAVDEISQSYRKLPQDSMTGSKVTSNSFYRARARIPGTTPMKDPELNPECIPLQRLPTREQACP
jgi:hypothetical protein